MTLQEELEAAKHEMLRDLSDDVKEGRKHAREALAEAYALGTSHAFAVARNAQTMECGCQANNTCGPVCGCPCHALGRLRAPEQKPKLRIVKPD